MLIWSSPPGGHADFFNEQWHGYTALSASQSRGWGWTNALHPDDVYRTTEHLSARFRLAQDDDTGIEARIRRKDGEYRWFWLRTSVMRDELGASRRCYVTSINIHDRKLAEESVRHSEALLKEAQRLAGLGIFSWRVGSDTMTWCRQLCNMFGFESSTPITRSMIKARTHPEDVLFIFDAVNAETEHRRSIEEQIRVLLPDGSTRYLHYCAYATTVLTGEIEYVGTVRDITDQHLASEALAQARLELAHAQ